MANQQKTNAFVSNVGLSCIQTWDVDKTKKKKNSTKKKNSANNILHASTCNAHTNINKVYVDQQLM